MNNKKALKFWKKLRLYSSRSMQCILLGLQFRAPVVHFEIKENEEFPFRNNNIFFKRFNWEGKKWD